MSEVGFPTAIGFESVGVGLVADPTRDASSPNSLRASFEFHSARASSPVQALARSHGGRSHPTDSLSTMAKKNSRAEDRSHVCGASSAETSHSISLLNDAKIGGLEASSKQKAFRASAGLLHDRQGDVCVELRAASLAYSSGDFHKAGELCRMACARQPPPVDALLLLGACLYQMGDYKGCIKANDAAIVLNPGLPEAHCNLANALQQLGNLDLAIMYYMSALRLRPTFTDAYANLASAYLQKGDATSALQAFATALAIDPSQNALRCSLGDLWRNQCNDGGRTTAARLFHEAIDKDRDYAPAWRGLGDCARESGMIEEAVRYYEEAVRLNASCAEAYMGLGLVFRQQKKLNKAEDMFAKAAQLRPSCAMTLGHLAGTQYDSGRLDRAIKSFNRAVELCPASPELLNNYGNVLREAGHFDDALKMYVSAVQLQLASLARFPGSIQPNSPIFSGFAFSAALTTCSPQTMRRPVQGTLQTVTPSTMLLNSAVSGCQNHLNTVWTASPVAQQLMQRLSVSYTNLAGVLKLLGRSLEAIAAYEHVVLLQPLVAEAHANLGAAYKDVSRHDDAIASYMQSLSLRPDFPEASANLIHSLQCVCDWRQYATLFSNLEVQVEKDLSAGRVPAVQPFHAMAYPFSAELALRISRKYAEHCLATARRLPGAPQDTEMLCEPPRLLPPGTRLRVAYVSSDFGNHPLSHLMGSVFGLHDRSRIEVFCYALSPDDGTEWRQRIMSEAEHFMDVSQQTSGQTARQMARDGIHIAINLNGYTKGARNEIFAMKPAPVQVSFMGFPATMGADYIPWIVLDKTVCPAQSRHCYSENVAYMPHSYFVNDYRHAHREVLDGANFKITRKDVGLPEDAIVYSCANQLYKFDPETFESWCRILQRVPGSVLWLLRFPPSGEERVKSEASIRGVDPSRIIFTDVAPKPIHVARSGLADVFLDTPRCNAHTTGCDVLWGGCPIVTMPLERMASRVAASLCNATGLGEHMVVSNRQEYEDRAVELGLDNQKREWLRSSLRSRRSTCALFDTARWVRNFEGLLAQMWKIECEGRGPRDFEVDEGMR